MTIEDDIAFLERIPIFRRLGSGALRIVAIGAESYSVETGQVLFTVGETADAATSSNAGRSVFRRNGATKPKSSPARARCSANVPDRGNQTAGDRKGA